MSLTLEAEVTALFREKMLEFIAWTEANWRIADKDRQSDDDWLEDKSDDYCEGYNASIDGLKGAFECWNEEFG